VERVSSRDGGTDDGFLENLRHVKERYHQAAEIFRPSIFERGALLAALFNFKTPSESSGEGLDNKSLEPLVNEISEELSQSLLSLRRREGEEIRRALDREKEVLSRSLKEFSTRLPELQNTWRRELESRMSEWAQLLAVKTPESDKIFQEFVLILEKRDVAEELQRIEAHIKALGSLLSENSKRDNLGKRLDFLAQELHREWTTLNNKVSDTDLSPFVADAKLAIERIREQSLNLL
jgi:uncharacterized protein (TIGR00255 family)